jgi:hypothetical protein
VNDRCRPQLTQTKTSLCLIELVETVEEGRGKLFDLLHPGRADFEAAGGVEKWREKLRPDETS